MVWQASSAHVFWLWQGPQNIICDLKTYFDLTKKLIYDLTKKLIYDLTKKLIYDLTKNSYL